MKTKLVPGVALLMSICAVGLIATLQSQASSSRGARVTLANAQLELESLQAMPWIVDPRTSAPASYDLPTMRALEGKVNSSIATLLRGGPPRELAAVPALLRTNYTGLLRIYRSGMRNDGWSNPHTTATLQELADAPHTVAATKLEQASASYERRAQWADKASLFGTAASILTLLVGFGLFFGRSTRARALAEKLSQENQRLLELSRAEAATDALTQLGNRRALTREIEICLSETSQDRRYALALFDLDGFKQYNDNFGHSAGDALLTRLGAALAATMSGIGTAYRIGGDEFVILAQVDSDGTEIAWLAAAALHEQGDGFEIACSYGLVLLPTEANSSNTALHLADQRMYEQKTSSRSSTVQHEVTDALVKMLNEHANGLEAHVSGVGEHAQQLAIQLRLEDSEVHRITIAARLHDVGKSAIPHTILNKAGSLDKEEWEFMRRHTLIGERIMLAVPSLAPVAGLVRSSHERWDGSGYPDQLASDQIPFGSRIIAVCDAFDAMVSERPYAKGITVAEALAELERCAGTQFDPEIVQVFSRMGEDLHRHHVKRAA